MLTAAIGRLIAAAEEIVEDYSRNSFIPPEQVAKMHSLYSKCLDILKMLGDAAKNEQNIDIVLKYFEGAQIVYDAFQDKKVAFKGCFFEEHDKDHPASVKIAENEKDFQAARVVLEFFTNMYGLAIIRDETARHKK